MSCGNDPSVNLNAGVGDGNSEEGINIRNLQQILAISTSMTNQEDKSDVQSVDDDKQKFFFEAIKSIRGMQRTFDSDVQLVKQSLEELRIYPDDVGRCSTALQSMIDLVDHIDVATDFKKLSGLSIVGRFLRSDNNELIRLSAEIVGTVAQNHPHCQKGVVDDDDVFPALFSILQSERPDNVKMKAIFAISSTIQNFKAGHDKFVGLNGYNVLINILKSSGIALQLRTCFVIDCLCRQFPQIKSILLEKEYVKYLIDLLTKIPIHESKETVLNAMLTFVEGCYDAVEECKKEEHNLCSILDYIISHYSDDFKEEKSKAVKLMNELDRFSK